MTVSRSRRIISSIAVGSNGDSRLREPPAVRADIITEICPKMWNSGNAVPIRSSAVPALICTEISAAASTLATVSSAPLGRPVVPEV